MSEYDAFEAVPLKELGPQLDACMDLGIPAMLWGPGGVGKSQAVYQASERRGGWMRDIRVNLREPVDFAGVPSVENGKTRFNPPEDMFVFPEGPGILFLDELPNAPRATQSALYQLVLDRKLGQTSLPDGVAIVAAGNRQQDHGGTFEMPLPLKTRFAHFEIEADIDSWLSWASSEGVHPGIMGFLKSFPQHLHATDRAQTANPVPRTWAMLSNMLSHWESSLGNVPPTIMQSLIGPAVSIEFRTYLTTYAKLPELPEFLKTPHLVEAYLDHFDMLYALNYGLVRHVDENNLDSTGKYIERLPKEFQVLFVDTLLERTPELLQGPIRTWTEENMDVLS